MRQVVVFNMLLGRDPTRQVCSAQWPAHDELRFVHVRKQDRHEVVAFFYRDTFNARRKTLPNEEGTRDSP